MSETPARNRNRTAPLRSDLRRITSVRSVRSARSARLDQPYEIARQRLTLRR
jgi:hypothetical protein